MVADPALARLERAVRAIAEQSRGRPLTGLTHDDADGVGGTWFTDDAVGFDPFPLLRALHEHGAVVAVMGQVAGIMHGSEELTGDLDLLWDGGRAGRPAMAAAFGSVDAALVDDDGRAVSCSPEAFALSKVVFRSATASGDCCTPALAWGDLPVLDMLARAQVARGDGGLLVRYLAAEDLIAMRRAVSRPKDLRRADELERLHRVL
ncbi:MAG: hypothetical protein QOG64_3058 [Acidimicrobiaceae bacterium]|nr:hypothetical protein [Acidimicrobiaceae bacterium]